MQAIEDLRNLAKQASEQCTPESGCGVLVATYKDASDGTSYCKINASGEPIKLAHAICSFLYEHPQIMGAVLYFIKSHAEQAQDYTKQ